MTIRVDKRQNIQASPTEFSLATRTYHFVAPFSLLNWVVAVRTRLGTVLKIHQVFCFVLEIYKPLFCYCCIIGNYCIITTFKWMEFLFTTGTKLTKTLCALPKHFHFIYLCWRLALGIWTPAKIIHTVNCLANTEPNHFLDEGCFDTNCS